MRIVTLLFLAILAGCASQEPNLTAYPYQGDSALMQAISGRTVVLAPVNFGIPSRNYLGDEEAALVDQALTQKMERAGFTFAPAFLFTNAWQKAIRTYGDPYDPTTGRMNTRAWQQVMVQAITEIKEARPDIQAVVFTDLIERDTHFSNGMKHVAQWDGVSREPRTRSASAAVPTDFDWGQTVQGISVWVNIYNMELRRVHSSMGGIELAQELDTRPATPRFVRARRTLRQERFIEEGVELALHPLLPMKDYPGLPQPLDASAQPAQ